MEGILGDKTFKRFQDLKRYKANNFKEPAFVEEICRGIAVNTKYSSNIQVNNKCFKVVTELYRCHCLKWLLLFLSLTIFTKVSLLIRLGNLCA